MFPEGPLFRGESLKVPLGRTLLVIVYFLFLNRIGLTEGDDAFVGFVFGLAGALAAWVVFSPSAGWKRRLCVALAACSTSGVPYAMAYEQEWLALAALVGTLVDVALVLSIAIFLLIRWGLKRDPATAQLQFGVKHLLGATLLMVPLAVMFRQAMPEIGDVDLLPLAVIALDALLICLTAQAAIGSRRLTAGELMGRGTLLVLTIVGLGIVLPRIPATQLRSTGWASLQATLGATIMAGYLLPRLDRFGMVIRRRSGSGAIALPPDGDAGHLADSSTRSTQDNLEAIDVGQNSPSGSNHPSPEEEAESVAGKSDRADGWK